MTEIPWMEIGVIAGVAFGCLNLIVMFFGVVLRLGKMQQWQDSHEKSDDERFTGVHSRIGRAEESLLNKMTN